MQARLSLILFSSSFLASTFSMLPVNQITENTSLFGKISLSPSQEAVKKTVTGYTGGSYSLSTISKRDRQRNLCIGFADPKPDHILVLEKGQLTEQGNHRTLMQMEGRYAHYWNLQTQGIGA